MTEVRKKSGKGGCFFHYISKYRPIGDFRKWQLKLCKIVKTVV